MIQKTIILKGKKKEKIDFLLDGLRDLGYDIKGYIFGPGGKRMDKYVGYHICKNYGYWRGKDTRHKIFGYIETIEQLAMNPKVDMGPEYLLEKNADILFTKWKSDIRPYNKFLKDFISVAEKTANLYDKNIVIDCE